MNIFYLKKIFLLILLILIAINLNAFNKKSNQDPLTHKSYVLFSEIHSLFVKIQSDLSKTIQKYLFLINLRKENEFLKQENTILKIQQQSFKDTLEENERFRQILNFSTKTNLKLLAAQITSYDLLARKNLLLINKGSDHGVKKFMGVLHPKGVVGLVLQTSPNSSQIITLQHSLFSLPVRNRRSRQVGLAVNSLNQLKWNLWDKNLHSNQALNNFKEGDVLITESSNQFPPGFLVGEIKNASPIENKSYPEIYIQPFVNFDSLEEVFIILKPFKSPLNYNEQEILDGK
ncbi:MAG: rod shape-determining protein MreC [Bdellovibrionales bacterium]|nr:rod shape-determining protein MreC [Bdellovibrionales bacterium]